MKLSEQLSAWANHVANDEYEICIEAADLLDECERALEDIMHWTENTHATANQIALDTLAKLRAQEKIDD